jgi:Flp pilus assembly protein TadG
MRQRLRDERGMSTVQVAILFPAVLIWLMLIVQYGLWWHAKQVANAAASEGVEAAQVDGASESDGESAAAEYLAEAGNLDDITVTVDRQAEVVIVEVRGEAPQLVPGITWSVEARSTEPIERFIPEGER